MPVFQLALCGLRHFKRALSALAVFVTLMMMPVQSQAQPELPQSSLKVRNDRGGGLRERIYEIRALRQSGQAVRISGSVCYSTCTMFLGLPQTCVSPTTVFGFHGPSSNGRPLDPDVFDHASQLIVDHYPANLQQWYWDTARHETRALYRINGAEIVRLGVPAC